MVQTIHVSVKGRTRYRVEGLRRSEALKGAIESALAGKEGVHAVSASALTGNVLVLHGSGRSSSSIAEAIAKIAEEHRKNGGSRTSSGAQILPFKPKSGPREVCTGAAVTEEPKTPGRAPTRRALRRQIVKAEAQPSGAWHLRDSASVTEEMEADRWCGLSSAAHAERLKRFGPNILPESVPRSGWSIFFDQLKSLPVALLGAAAVVSIATGGLADAAVIMAVVGINAAIGYATESGTEKTIRSLKNLVSPSALVVRDGKTAQVPAEDIVVGDLLMLRPGSYVSADARLLEVQHLSVDESALTGESMPVVKRADTLYEADLPLADRKNMVYKGTLVTGGQGIALVVATGQFTELGLIQQLAGEAESPRTPMEQQLDRMGSQLALLSGAVCAGVFAIGLLRGYGLLQMLKSSISLAVAAVPEGLPAVATTTLALGIRNMRRQSVLIRRLEAVETLGSVQTICLDKTGTITVNRMSVTEAYAGMNRMAVSDGKFISVNGTYTNPYSCVELLKLIHVCVLCNESEVFGENGQFAVTGTATENALIHMALNTGVNVEQLRNDFPLVRVMHRSETRNIMLTEHRMPGSPGKLLAVKGAPREVLALCTSYMDDGREVGLDDELRAAIKTANERMAGESLRVLGVAFAVVDEGVEPLLDEEPANGTFVWLGIVGMTDPVRPGVKQLVKEFHAAGIDTVMITGDQSPTAYAVGKELRLSRTEEIEILDSRHLSDIQPDVLRTLCERVHVFSRVSPAHKLQIVQALQGAGRIVAMTGDGINDGPALKAAAIGVAMGHTGTDVAREVADVVLEDDNLETMIVAVSQGRTIYNNIRKTIHFLLSTNMSEIMVMFGGIAVGLGEPLTAMQLLWINLVSDIFPGLALALEPAEPDVLSRPPRDPSEEILSRDKFKRMLFESSVLSASAFGAYGYGLARYGRGPQAGTMAFLSLTMAQTLHALSCRSETHSLFDREKLPPNRHLTLALGGTFALQAAAMALPPLRSLLGISRIGFLDGAVVGASALLPLAVNEVTK